MRLKGNSYIHFEYEVYLLNYTINIFLNWAFEVFRFLQNLKT